MLYCQNKTLLDLTFNEISDNNTNKTATKDDRGEYQTILV